MVQLDRKRKEMQAAQSAALRAQIKVSILDSQSAKFGPLN